MVNGGLNNSVNGSLPGISGPREATRTNHKRKRRGCPRRSRIVFRSVAYQRSSCSTLACDWLASDSAETAMDWRVESAWLSAASWLVSASVRFDEPVCSTSIRFLLKSWRICTIERFEPSVEASARSVEEAVESEV